MLLTIMHVFHLQQSIPKANSKTLKKYHTKQRLQDKKKIPCKMGN